MIVKSWNVIVGFLIGITTLATSLCFAGHETKGGGDVVVCQRSLQNELEGMYSLDYVLTYQNHNNHPSNFLVEVDSWQESKDRIWNLLQTKLPYFHRSYENFIDHMGNLTDPWRDRIWQQAAYDLIDISDEDFLMILPDNCFEQNGSEINIIQAVIRDRNTDTNFITYLFDGDIYDQLKDDDSRALQFSFLMIHEWMWDFFPAASINRMRDAIRLIHSRQMDDLTPAQLWQSFRNLGISETFLGPKPGPGPSSGSRLAINSRGNCVLHNGSITCWQGSTAVDMEVDDVVDFVMAPSTFGGWAITSTGELVEFGDGGRPPEESIRNPISIHNYSSDSYYGITCVLTKYDGVRCWRAHYDDTVWTLDFVDPTSVRIGKDFYCGTTLHGFRCKSIQYDTAVTEWSDIDYVSLNDYSVGLKYMCMIDEGKLSCRDKDGNDDTSIPQFVKAEKVSVSHFHACAIGDSKLLCWSWHTDPEVRRALSETPVLSYPYNVSVVGNHSCAIDRHGVRCWGERGSWLDVPSSLYPLQ